MKGTLSDSKNLASQRFTGAETTRGLCQVPATKLSHKANRIGEQMCCEMVCRKCRHWKHQFTCDCTLHDFETGSFCLHTHAVCFTYFLTEYKDTACKSTSKSDSVPQPLNRSNKQVACVRNRGWLLRFAKNAQEMVGHLSNEDVEQVNQIINKLKEILDCR